MLKKARLFSVGFLLVFAGGFSMAAPNTACSGETCCDIECDATCPYDQQGAWTFAIAIGGTCDWVCYYTDGHQLSWHCLG